MKRFGQNVQLEQKLTGRSLDQCGGIVGNSLSLRYTEHTGVCILPCYSKYPVSELRGFLKKNFIYLFSEKEEGREKERARNIDVRRETSIGCLLHAPYWGPSPNPGMCPDWESNQRPLGSQASAQSTEPHQPGQAIFFFLIEQAMRSQKSF